MDPPPTDEPSVFRLTPINRRSKPQLSCKLCRQRKLRCDRKQPCSTCTTRGMALSCAYLSTPGSHLPLGLHSRQPRGQRQQVTRVDRPQGAIQDRLRHLEQSVVSLMQKTTSDGQEQLAERSTSGLAHPGHQLDSPSERAIQPEGYPDSGSAWFSSSDMQYIEGAHWAAILNGIADLREHLEREDKCHVEQPVMSNTFLLYGCKHASKEDILDAVPPRPTVDRFVSQYFNRLDLAPSCLHKGQFLREYEQFWQTPAETPITWLGLLFSMICLAMLASNKTESSSFRDRNPSIDLYREKIVQCLILGEYTKSGRYTFETLYHYLTIEYSIRKDADQDIWILLGISVNVALRMGYHRDPSHLSGITPFSGEMRRRAWATLLQGDILISTQMGMPRMIKDWKCDTVEPRNLNDADFDEDSVELPPSRPETEITTVSHLIARRRIFAALGAIADFSGSVRPVAYADVMRLDRTLHDAEATIPTHLRMKGMALAVTDSPQVIMHRLFIRLMFQKGRIMLHCKYLSLPRTTSSDEQTSHSYSRRSCIEAALSILEIQQIFDEETIPDGQLHMMRWRTSSFVTHEFLTATMLLCFVGKQLHGNHASEFVVEGYTLEDRIIPALKTSHSIWSRSKDSSTEAKIAANALSLVLSKITGSAGTDAEGSTMSGEECSGLDQSLPPPSAGLDMNILDENFHFGFPVLDPNRMSQGPVMITDQILPWQWQTFG